MKQFMTTKELQNIAFEGRDLARKLVNKATDYRRVVERMYKR